MPTQKKTVDFLDISPFIRYAHRVSGATDTNHLVPWRYIYDYQFLFVTKGTMQVVTNEENYTLGENDIHIMPPMVWHHRVVPEGISCDYYSVHFDFINLGSENDFSPEEIYIARCNTKDDIAPIDERLLGRPLCVLGSMELPSKMRIADSVKYTEILSNIIEVQNKKDFGYEIDLKCGMLMLLKQILTDVRLRVTGGEQGGGDGLSAITQYILDNFAENISFDALSHIFGYSYSNFRKLFKKKSGKSPNEFLTDIRIKKAAELLYSGKYTIGEISYMVGYDDSAYFSRLFKKKKGVSPREFVRGG